MNRNTKEFRNPLCLKTLNILLVKSNLEFSSLICSQHLSTYYSELDNVQNKLFKVYQIN